MIDEVKKKRKSIFQNESEKILKTFSEISEIGRKIRLAKLTDLDNECVILKNWWHSSTDWILKYFENDACCLAQDPNLLENQVISKNGRSKLWIKCVNRTKIPLSVGLQTGQVEFLLSTVLLLLQLLLQFGIKTNTQTLQRVPSDGISSVNDFILTRCIGRRFTSIAETWMLLRSQFFVSVSSLKTSQSFYNCIPQFYQTKVYPNLG